MDELAKSISTVLQNGARLAEDAQYLLDFERYASSFALCILAQEEYAKAFLLHLIEAGAIPWNPEVRRLLHDHSSKQLLAMIMEFLEPDSEDFMAWLDKRSKASYPIPSYILDSLNIIRYEKVTKEGQWSWIGDEDPPCDPQARSVGDGKVDKEKQNALYVKIGKNGQVINNPEDIDQDMAFAELERTERLGQMLRKTETKHEPMKTIEYEKIFNTFRVLFGLSTIDEYSKNWWA